MNYVEWEGTVPQELRADAIWRMEAYRLALFLGDMAWNDATRLLKDRRTTRIADQLYRAAGCVSADLTEGYSRGTGKARAQFYEFALGSARESRDWFYKGCHVLGPDITNHRLDLATRIIRLLLKMIPADRQNLRLPASRITNHESE